MGINMTSSPRFFLVFAIVMFGVLNITPAHAGPNIHFTDYRVLLTEKQSTKNYQIFNQGDTAAYCYTNLVDHNVSPDGQLTVATKDNLPATSAQSLLRVSPKRVLIPAKSNQKVRVLARRLIQQKSGEWVSYLNLRCREHSDNNTAGIKIRPNFVFNIPVVVRKGHLQVEAAIQQAHIAQANDRYFAEAILSRRGKRSLFGDISVTDETGVLAVRKGFSHYLQSADVPLLLPLKAKPKGEVIIEFKETPQFGGDISLTTVIK